MSKLRRVGAWAVAHAPLNASRIALYRLLFGYRFGKGARIGLGTVINVDRFVCGDGVVIRRGNSFAGPISIELGEGTFVGRWNRFECSEGAGHPSEAHKGYRRSLRTGTDCLINEGHLFDLFGHIEIGAGTWIAGFASQFLTHGAGAMRRDISLGRDCFVGSAVRFAPGSGVGDRTIVGMGSVLTKTIADENVVVGGFPAKVIRERGADDAFEFTRTW